MKMKDNNTKFVFKSKRRPPTHNRDGTGRDGTLNQDDLDDFSLLGVFPYYYNVFPT